MHADFPLFPPSASTMAVHVDRFYLFMCAVTVVFGLGIAAVLLVFAVKYRRRSPGERPPEIHGSLLLELIWSVIPFLLTVVMFVWATWLFFTQARVPDDAIRINVEAPAHDRPAGDR
jgi:cytochrome c oxidase subunit 2